MNYFDFFEIPVAFEIDVTALRTAYYKNSKRFHPDFHTLSDETQQAEMLEQSTLNNQAFQTLSDRDKRIRYILQINDMLGDEGNQPALPQEFLMEMMDINEKLMELEFDFDQKKYEATLAEISKQESELASTVEKELANTNPPGEEELKRVRDFYLKRRYLLRIRENLSKFAGSN